MVKCLNEKIVCEKCLSALSCSEEARKNSFIKHINKGGLIYPSKDVIDICKAIESLFRINVYYGKKCSNFKPASISSKVMEIFLERNIFSFLNEHMYDMEPLNNHILYLIKAISEKYLNVRFYYYSKILSSNHMSERRLFTKLIFFKGQ